ncbi:tetratricopeptide repeat protein [Nocardia transvalensis]|uniref:tetratricopeptide repeat protein n=1 Tax=Nocardia transvalensis TaxID=37333 RepID=UPI0018961655|nr:tetratricopeptide repeat protein [Nocardia transvalensis]MBF6328221.1 sel1 repeat family protein [Nocardia transvalensis]
MTGPYPYVEQDESQRPLAERYVSADPVDWCGTAVYPMYCEPLGPDPTVVALWLRAAAPPEGLLGLGVGLSVLGGHVALQGRRLRGVDVWTDAMADGIELEVCAAGPDASFTLTPVWMDMRGTTESWTGNYGVVIERTPEGKPLLRCSTGVGPPDFGELVVEMTVTAAPTDQSRYRGALYELGVAMHGRGDLEQACALWRQAADFGHAGAAYDLGVVRFRCGELREAERWWRAAADHGDVRAMAGLAEVLDRQGNPSEARVWRACANGTAHS